MVLLVLLSSSISSFTATATSEICSLPPPAALPSAMLRTWPVRLAAIAFTLSVRSFQVPATPGTCAWPPSLPSVPTSRATRVTSPERSEEHTSELQSQSNLVCRLLLEKKQQFSHPS